MKTTPCTEGVRSPETLYSFDLAPRCGAKTRSGSPCKSPAIRYKKRCRMHGGRGSGAPKANKNAFKHGYTTHEQKTLRIVIKDEILNAKKLNKYITELDSDA